MLRHRSLATLALAITLPFGRTSAQTQVIGFEGLAGLVPESYENLTWSTTPFNFWHVALSGSLFRPVSGLANAASEELSFITFSRPGESFTLNSIFLSVFLATAPERIFDVEVTGWFEGQLRFETRFALDPINMVKHDFNWTGIDQVEMIATRGRLLVDDISITATPEPATMALVATGLVGVFGGRRLKRRKS
ncbi:MAG TPA: PEP-CTERM sorting domain-containing protein [Gemmatimonadaceae bacterium]